MLQRSLFTLMVKLERRFSNRGFGRIPGVRSLKQTLLRLTAPRRRMVEQVGDFRMYLSAQDTGVSRALIGNGDYERYELGLFRARVKPGMVILDVGANIGYYSLAIAAETGNGATVYAFEPEPATLSQLRDNLALNKVACVVVEPCALADKNGELTLHVDPTNLGKHSGVGDGPGKTIKVTTTTIDAFVRERRLERIDMIKIDVEGAEGLVIEGARDTIARYQPTLFMEYTPEWLRRAGTDPHALLKRLIDAGYVIDLIDSRNQRLQRVDMAKLDALEAGSRWTFQANLILTPAGR